MDVSDVKKILEIRPFRPLKFSLSDGSSVKLMHPELAKLFQYKIVVFVQGSDPTILDDDIHISLEHIVRIDNLGKKPAIKSGTAHNN